MTPECPDLPAQAAARAGLPGMRWTMASLALPMLLSSLGTSIANVGLPQLAQAFGASFQQVQWVVLAYLLAVTALIVSAGRLGDLADRKRLLLAGITLFTLASVLCGAAPNLGLLIGARALQGLGAALMMALTMALTGDAVPGARSGSAMGLLGAMSALGTALGPALGGMLIAAGGWRAIFLAGVPFGVVALLLAWRRLPPDTARAPGPRPGFDLAGSVLLALALAAFALAMTAGASFGPLNGALLASALAGAAAFVWWQRRCAWPLVPPALFRNRALAAGFAMSVLVTTVMMATLVVGPFYLSGALGLDTARVGLAMSCGPLVSAFGGVPAGRMADRFGAHRTTLAGLLAMAAGCALLPVLPAGLGVPGYVVPLAILTAGYALFQTSNNSIIMACAAPGQRGVVSGLLGLARNLGLIAGASSMGALFALRVAAAAGTMERPAAVAAGMQLTFGAALVLIAAAIAIARMVRPAAR